METTLQKHIDAYKAKLGINDENFIRPEGWHKIALAFGMDVLQQVVKTTKEVEPNDTAMLAYIHNTAKKHG